MGLTILLDLLKEPSFRCHVRDDGAPFIAGVLAEAQESNQDVTFGIVVKTNRL